MVLFYVWIITTFGWDTMQDQELMQEKLQEMMGLNSLIFYK